MPSPAPDPRTQAAIALSREKWKKLEGYLLRLPLLTRIVMLLIAVFHFLAAFGVPVEDYFALDPAKMDLGQSMSLVDWWTVGWNGLMQYLAGLYSAPIKYLPAHSSRSNTHDNELGCAHAIAREIREGDWDVQDAIAYTWTYATELSRTIYQTPELMSRM